MKAIYLISRKSYVHRTRIQELNFIKPYKEPTVEFLGTGATLQFYLDKKNANQFDILLGLLPTRSVRTIQIDFN